MSDVSGFLTSEQKPERPTVSRRFGTVLAVNAGPPQTVDVELAVSGITIPAVPILASYAPAVGDAVVVDFTDDTPLAIGAVGGGAWTAYTPVWTAASANPVLNNGTLSGSYHRTGKLVTMRLFLIAGTTTTFGTDEWSFTLPLATPNDNTRQSVNGWVDDTSTANRWPIAGNISPNGVSIVRVPVNGTPGVKSTVPFAWATGDELTLQGSYEIA